MKSLSNDLASTDKTVSKADFDALKTDHEALGASYQNTLRKIRNWMFGLAAANAILTIVLVIVLHH